MDKLIIRGGNALSGEVEVSGSKNTALPIMAAAAILADSVSEINNLPRVRDLVSMSELLIDMGVSLQLFGNSLIIKPGVRKAEADYELVRKMRASIYVLGPLLARYGRAKVSLPGGCIIGPRPIDYHLQGLRKLGAKIEVRSGYILAETKRLKGAEVDCHFSLGTTANLMMAAVLADGITHLYQAAMDPEILSLAEFIRLAGADIQGGGTSKIRISGPTPLKGVSYKLPPDRIEAGTFAIVALISKGELKIKGAEMNSLLGLTSILKKIGAEILWHEHENELIVSANRCRFSPQQLETGPFPQFSTDFQPLVMPLLALAGGISSIKEKVFPKRFIHTPELNRMGASITVSRNLACIEGVEELKGAPVMASEVRGGAGLVLAGLAAKGETVISRVYHIDRGYHQFESKLKAVGADIAREVS